VQIEPPEADEDRDLPDPALEAIAAAILDGTPIDWQNTSQDSDPGILDQLHVLADLAALHRSLTPEPGGGSVPENELTPVHGMVWGPLTLQERIGRGAFGEVFRALDTRLHRDVALKLLHPDAERRRDPDASIREGRLLARVRHPNVVTVHGADRIDGRVGIWTEFIQGRTLAHLVHEQGRFSPDEATAIGIDLCAALSAVHGAGLLHRDVKPQNVMREQGGRIVLMDFGAGKDRPEEGPASDADRAGTPLYIAPEIWDGAPATTRSDVYSLGVLLFYLASGSYPVNGATADAIREAHHSGRRTLLRDACRDAPSAFVDVVERSLAADPKDRFQSAGEFETALRRTQAAEVAETVELPAPADRPRAGSWLTWAAVGGAVVFLVAAVVSFGDVRARLGGRDQEASAVYADTLSTKVRRVPMPPYSMVASPSRDGRYLPFMAKGDIYLLEIASGRSRQITDKETPGGYPAISPDGSLISYERRLPDGSVELRVADIDDTWPAVNHRRPTVIAMRGDRDTTFIPIEWSSDGQQILCWAQRTDGSADLVLVLRTGAAHSVLQTFAQRHPRRASLSPDGRYVVYDFVASPPDPQHDLFIVGTDGSAPRVLLSERFDETLPVWTPDGSGVFFIGDRGGTIDGWVVKVTDGVAHGAPTLVARNLDRVTPFGLTSAGALFYMFEINSAAIFTQSIDEDAPTRPKPVAAPRGWGTTQQGPWWSPDGGTLAYFSIRGMGEAPRESVITLMNIKTGQTRDLLPSLSYFGAVSPRWSADGHELLVRGRDFRYRWGYFRIDIATGATTPVVIGRTVEDAINFGPSFEWMRDGRGIAYTRHLVGVVTHEFETGVERTIVPDPPDGTILSFGTAPDGRHIAFSLNTGKQEKDIVSSLMVQSPSGNTHELLSLPGPSAIRFQEWTPDGRDVIYSTQTAVSPVPRLWRIPASGGTPRDMMTTVDAPQNLNAVALSPDGRRIAYTAGRTAFEIWTMEGFLPR
jgi:serine/threonine-protein kinase